MTFAWSPGRSRNAAGLEIQPTMTTLPYPDGAHERHCLRCSQPVSEETSFCAPCRDRLADGQTGGARRTWIGLTLASGCTLLLAGFAVGVYFREAPRVAIPSPAPVRLASVSITARGDDSFPASTASASAPVPESVAAPAPQALAPSSVAQPFPVKLKAVKPNGESATRKATELASATAMLPRDARPRSTLQAASFKVTSRTGTHRQRTNPRSQAQRTLPSRRSTTARRSRNTGPTYVYLNGGTLLGTLPLRNAKLPPGNHRLVFWTPRIGGRTQRRISVKPGQTLQVNADIRPARRF